jgi:hypothetical protein
MLGQNVRLQALSEVGHPIAGKQQRDIMAGILLVGPSIALGLIERGPQVFTRFLCLEDSDHLSFIKEDAVGLFSIEVLAPALVRQGEIREVPALGAEVFLDKQFSLILIDGPHMLSNATERTNAGLIKRPRFYEPLDLDIG